MTPFWTSSVPDDPAMLSSKRPKPTHGLPRCPKSRPKDPKSAQDPPQTPAKAPKTTQNSLSLLGVHCNSNDCVCLPHGKTIYEKINGMVFIAAMWESACLECQARSQDQCGESNKKWEYISIRRCKCDPAVIVMEDSRTTVCCRVRGGL